MFRSPYHRFLTAALLVTLAGAAPAAARVSAPTVLDGPSAGILEIGAVAMADDGTGGVIYRRRDPDGRAHVFVAQFDGARWRQAQRVDVGQRFDSSWPTLAAAPGGRLVAVWVHEFGDRTDRMFSAVLDAGARRFLEPVPVDLNVGEAIATWPRVAMNRAGVAYVVYRVIGSTAQTNAALPAGTVDGEYRVARTSGRYWSVVGQSLDRNPSAPQRAPDAANGPRVGVDDNGNAVVAWHEPDNDGVDRVWARRVFGGALGAPLQASPSQRDGLPVRGRVDQFSLDVAGFGQAVVAYRELGTGSDPAAGARIWTNALPDTFSPGGAAFAGSRAADGVAPGTAPSAAPGPVAVATTAQGLVTNVFGAGAAVVAVSGDDRDVAPAVRLDDGTSNAVPDPVVELGVDGGGTQAWKVTRGAVTAVLAREARADGSAQTRLLSSPQGGPVADLRSAGSGLGDATLAWLQGTGPATQVMASIIDAPPVQFASSAPLGWVRGPRARVGWDAAPHAVGGLTYALEVGGEILASGLRGTRFDVVPRTLGTGRHPVRVIARDTAGQTTASLPSTLSVDLQAPTISFSVATAARRVQVTVSDRQGSGVRPESTVVRFGDGARSSGKATRVRHRYRRAGRFTVTVRTRDRVGNGRVVRRTVVVG